MWPTFPEAGDYYFVFKAITGTELSTDTYCNYETQFIVRLYQLPQGFTISVTLILGSLGSFIGFILLTMVVMYIAEQRANNSEGYEGDMDEQLITQVKQE